MDQKSSWTGPYQDAGRSRPAPRARKSFPLGKRRAERPGAQRRAAFGRTRPSLPLDERGASPRRLRYDCPNEVDQKQLDELPIEMVEEGGIQRTALTRGSLCGSGRSPEPATPGLTLTRDSLCGSGRSRNAATPGLTLTRGSLCGSGRSPNRLLPD
ncbi:MAG: hypothetical protein MZV64_09420 [Ignavibacteriales bacterium]|nr:hypothetical protein [Ignavibacteriales bacterium]